MCKLPNARWKFCTNLQSVPLFSTTSFQVWVIVFWKTKCMLPTSELSIERRIALIFGEDMEWYDCCQNVRIRWGIQYAKHGTYQHISQVLGILPWTCNCCIIYAVHVVSRQKDFGARTPWFKNWWVLRSQTCTLCLLFSLWIKSTGFRTCWTWSSLGLLCPFSSPKHKQVEQNPF